MKLFRNIKNFFASNFDLEDIFTVFGLGMLFYGIYQIYIPASYIAIGSIILIIIAFGSRSRKNK